MMKQLLVFLVLSLPLCAEVKITKAPDRIAVQIDGKPFTELFFGPETTKPYLHPLRSATGKVVTRGYPMESIDGESKDHPHHRGLWFSHGEVNGYDFWATEPSQKNPKKGKIVLDKIEKVESGKNSGIIQATFNWVDPQGKTLLVETRKMTFYSHPTMRIIDFDITLQPVEKVTFGDTKEGTFAIRLAAGLEEPGPKSIPVPKRTGRMVSSEGKQGEKEVWGKRASWVDYFGELDGEKVGIAIFDNPKNPRHPTYWHSRSYGLFAANIFGERDFYDDKSRNGSMTIEPGQTLRFQYRVIIHPGDHQTADVVSLYKNYASGESSLE